MSTKPKSAILVCLAIALSATSLSGCMGLQMNPQERSFFTALDDFNIQTELNARLIGESGVLFANVNSTVLEGRIHMTGTVATQGERLQVTRMAWAIPAVKEVINDIEVTSETNVVDTARDHWITAQVRSLILNDKAIRDSNYTIDTENAVVYVHGIAQDRLELDRVLRHANSVAEAKRVVNYALLKDDPRRFTQPGQRTASQQSW
jgi:osmotically-inducible protein OsmY